MSSIQNKQEGFEATANGPVTEDEGATLIEYTILAALLVFVVIVAAAGMGKNVSSQYSQIASVVETL